MIGKIIRWLLLRNIDDDIIDEKITIAELKNEIKKDNNQELRKEMSKELLEKAIIRLKILEELKEKRK